MSATTQVARSSETGAATGRPARLWVIATGCLIALLGMWWWWNRSGLRLIVRTLHPYRVTRISTADDTMDLVHGNHRYVVRCAEHCSEFTSGGFYPMDDAGAVLRFTHAGQTISLPIIEEETTFDVTGGHG